MGYALISKQGMNEGKGENKKTCAGRPRIQTRDHVSISCEIKCTCKYHERIKTKYMIQVLH